MAHNGMLTGAYRSCQQTRHRRNGLLNPLLSPSRLLTLPSDAETEWRRGLGNCGPLGK